jgi:hypothetical protein
MNSFGSGFLVGRAAATTANPNPTPRKFGILQEVSVDDSFTTKNLVGSLSAPLRQFRGERKTEIKAKFARINAALLAELYYNATTTTGSVLACFDEVQTIPSATTYTLTAKNAGTSGANFLQDYGVEYATSGVPFTLVTTAPTVGEYSVTSEGVYTFAAADEGVTVVLSYTYSSTTGVTVSVPNLAQQESPYFEVFLTNPQDGGYNKHFFKCSSSKLTENFKQGDIMIPEFDMTVLDTGTGVLFVDYFATA